MATVKDAIKVMQQLAPDMYEYKKEYDNIGLMLGSDDDEVKRVLCCLDVTSAVIDEAIQLGANLIVAHHPVIYYPIKNVTDKTVQGKLLLRAARYGINIYAAHTNLDFSRDGINDFVANLVGLRNIRALEPYGEDESVGFGRIGELSNTVFCTTLKGELETVLGDNYVRVVGEPLSSVKKIAVINGGGGGDVKYVDMAVENGADCLITADVKHHVAVYARERGITLIEPQHFTMEHIYIARLTQLLRLEAKASKLDLEIYQSYKENNPRF